MEIITQSAQETQRIGTEFANKLKPRKNGACVVCLSGDLGSGKTTFVQGFIRELIPNSRIISPTFIILREYEALGEFTKIYHADFYRLEGNLEDEMEILGLFDIFENHENIILIEWAEKIEEFIPKEAVWINFQEMDENIRKIIIKE